MESPTKIVNELRSLLADARESLAGRKWEAAKSILEKAIAIDALDPTPLGLLAEAHEGMGAAGEAESCRLRAKALREDKWKRKVEAEARGQHEMLGKAARHEIP